MQPAARNGGGDGSDDGEDGGAPVWLRRTATPALGRAAPLAVGVALAATAYSARQVWRIKMDSARAFQVFVNQHPFERYDQHFARTTAERRRVDLIFGLARGDTGSVLDPTDKGRAILVPAFDMTPPAAQAWLLALCTSAREAPWFGGDAAIMTHDDTKAATSSDVCAVESARVRALTPCADASGQGVDACCGYDAFPLPADVFAACLREVRDRTTFVSDHVNYTSLPVASSRLRSPNLRREMASIPASSSRSTRMRTMRARACCGWASRRCSRHPTISGKRCASNARLRRG